jgi:hypothetical protein
MIWKAEVSEFDEKSEKTFLVRRYSPVKAVSDEGSDKLMGGEVRRGRLASADIAEKLISHRPLPIYNRGLYNFARNALAPNKFRAICAIFDTVIAHVLHLRIQWTNLNTTPPKPSPQK